MGTDVAYCLFPEDGGYSNYQETTNISDSSLWMAAMQKEVEALHKNQTWKLMSLPPRRKTIGNKQIYKIKRDSNDQVEQYCARLIVKEYAHKEGVDFNEIFSAVFWLTSIRIVLTMCARFDLHLKQLNVKIVFLHGELKEKNYMLQSEDFKENGKENLFCKLTKSLYDLKQALRCWYKRFDPFISSLGYNKLNSDHFIYCKRFEGDDFIILLLYVDDMLVASS